MKIVRSFFRLLLIPRVRLYVQGYCDVLNKIYWKIPKTDPEFLAAEATERIMCTLGVQYVIKNNYIIQWDVKSEQFFTSNLKSIDKQKN